jgi:hypothetical protein
MMLLLAKYAACVAAGTALFHMHACFKLSDAILGPEKKVGDSTWWEGKALLAVMSLLLQKLPMSALSVLFRVDRKRRRAIAMKLKPHKVCKCCRVPVSYRFVPWVAGFLFIVACFGTTIILTSTGFLQTGGGGGGGGPGDEDTTHCGCAGITAGKDVEGDWIKLLLIIQVFRIFFYRPAMILAGTLLFLFLERRKRRRQTRRESRRELAATEVEMLTTVEVRVVRRSVKKDGSFVCATELTPEVEAERQRCKEAERQRGQERAEV